MKEQVKNINGTGQIAVFKHDQFFHHVRHGTERRQQHKYCDEYQNRVGYAVKKTPHESFSDESFTNQFLTRTNIIYCQ